MRGLPKDLLVGTETADDAAVYRLNDTQALVATTDFFTPIVDDPYDFGRIAATNAISDVYAMGGRPIMALALVGMPLDKLPVSGDPQDPGRRRVGVRAAGIPVAGGHSIDTLEPIYGLVALGLVHPDKVKRNSTARRPGDVLILGKPLGVGILSAALKKGKLSEAGLRADARLDDPAQHAGRGARRAWPACTRSPTSPASASPDTCSRSAAARSSPREVRFRRAAGDRGGARVGEAGHRHRRVGPQLERLRRTRSRCRPVRRTGSASCSPIRRPAAGCWSPARRDAESTRCWRSSAATASPRRA